MGNVYNIFKVTLQPVVKSMGCIGVVLRPFVVDMRAFFVEFKFKFCYTYMHPSA